MSEQASRTWRMRHGAGRRAIALGAAGSVVAAFAVVATTGTVATAAGTTCALDSSYGRMFPTVPATNFSYSDLDKLAEKSMEVRHFQPSGSPTDEMPDFPAGYNYFGQFVDHDITLDPRPDDLTTPVDVAGLTNNRTPQLDLDSLYAGGPSVRPEMYEADGVHFKMGVPLSGAESDHDATDLLRGPNGQAIIGDARNDENKIVASFHSIMTRFHNKMYDMLASDHPTWTKSELFAETQRQVTYYYQYALLTDFLPKIVGESELADVVKRGNGTWTTNLKFYDSCAGSMPVEFSGAAYRFGHSLVRNDYEINELHSDLEVFTTDMNPRSSLVGFGPSPSDFAIDWKYFFDLPQRSQTPQDAYQFDNSLVPALRRLPGREAGQGPTTLATRNLLRGQQLGLPSGQDIARAMGVKPLPDREILVGPAVDDAPSGQLVPINRVSKAFKGKAPLWAYIMAEAAAYNTHATSSGDVYALARSDERLGPVGGRIVAETFVGLLKADPTSILNNPSWSPDLRTVEDEGRFGLDSFVSITSDLGPTGVSTVDIESEDGYADLGTVLVGLSSYETISIHNRSRATVSVGVPSIVGTSEWTVSTNSCGTSRTKLSPGDYCTVVVKLRASSRGAKMARLLVPTNGASGTVHVDMKGKTLL